MRYVDAMFIRSSDFRLPTSHFRLLTSDLGRRSDTAAWLQQKELWTKRLRDMELGQVGWVPAGADREAFPLAVLAF